MARAQDPNSANSQFFIMLADNFALNGKYTVVGQVVSGMQSIDSVRQGTDKVIRTEIAGPQPRISPGSGGTACHVIPIFAEVGP